MIIYIPALTLSHHHFTYPTEAYEETQQVLESPKINKVKRRLYLVQLSWYKLQCQPCRYKKDVSYFIFTPWEKFLPKNREPTVHQEHWTWTLKTTCQSVLHVIGRTVPIGKCQVM